MGIFMKNCAAGCGEWAQWRLTYPGENGNQATVRLVCTRDKDAEVSSLPEELRPKVTFVGCAPIGK